MLDNDDSVEYVGIAAHQRLDSRATQKSLQHLSQGPTGNSGETREVGEVGESGDSWEVREIGDLSANQW